MADSLTRQWNYLPTGLDEAWGLYVTGLGAGEDPGAAAEPGTSWRLLFVVRGAAVLAIPGRRRQRVEAGDVLLLEPGGGARLSPEPGRACRIHRLDFAGPWMDRWVQTGLFGSLPRVIRAGFDEGLMGLVVQLVEIAKEPGAGAARVMAGILGNLLARLETVARSGAATGRQGRLVLAARQLLSDSEQEPDLEAAAQQLGVSYSWFRRSFRAQTGLAPQRFRCLQRLDRACRLLGDTALPVGEISARLGFSSQAYFARMFRKETGLSPSVWRAKQR